MTWNAPPSTEVLHTLTDLLAGRPAEVRDWSKLVAQAQKERLLLPLWAAIDRKIVPGPLLKAVDEQVTELTLKEVHHSRQLGELVRLLGPDVLAYKGPTLAHLAFHSSSARQSGDLDLLVPPHLYQNGVATLLKDGFEFLYPPPGRCFLTLNYEITLFHPRRQVTVDLHRSFFSEAMPLRLTGRTTVTISGQAVPTLPPDELFLLLAVHGCKHAWRELRWVYDLVGLMSRQALDWEKIARLSRLHGSRRAVSVALEISRTLFGTPVPSSFAGDQTARRLAQESREYIFASAPSLRQLQAYAWRVFDRVDQRIRYLLITLFRPHDLDLAWVDLPENMWYFYYPLRPIRVAWRYFKAKKRNRHG